MPENSTAPKQIFNLLRPAKPIIPTWDKIYYWLSGTARILILFVEIIIIAGFTYRVIIDRQSNDIKDQVSQSESILKVYESRESIFRKYQQEVSQANSMISSSDSFVTIINQLLSQVPKMDKSNLVLNSDGTFNLNAISSKEIATQVEQLFKTSKYTKNVATTNLVIKDNDTVNYSIQGQLILGKR